MNEILTSQYHVLFCPILCDKHALTELEECLVKYDFLSDKCCPVNFPAAPVHPLFLNFHGLFPLLVLWETKLIVNREVTFRST